ncbi:hypothetical protein N7454_007164 [Penicillium verhagenii]|nr:hypothetical protein N7454_007164 [Penicillium verhagenii]
MSTNTTFNPTLLLQVLPLAASTGTLAHALLELQTNSAFLNPEIRPKSDPILPKWYGRVFNRAVVTVVGLNMTTIVTAAMTLYRDSSRGELQTTRFYWMGLIGAIGHLVFVPFVAGPVKGVVYGRGNDSPSAEMAR